MIKLFGYLLMTIGLIGGSLAAITAYRPVLSLPDDQLIGLSLSSGAGQQPDNPHAPLIPTGTVLTAENLAQLRGAEAARVPPAKTAQRLVVKQFSFARWDLAWAAGASIGALALGSCIVKFETRRRIKASAAAASTDPSKGPSPEVALRTIKTTLDSLRAELNTMTDDHKKNERIIEVIGELTLVQVAAIVDQRYAIMGRQGLGGMAAFMDRFASAERAMNRAWSAAADGVYEEAELCLNRAIETIPEAQARLKSS